MRKGGPLSARESQGNFRDLAGRVLFRIATSKPASAARAWSNSRRLLPSYLVVGTQKGGTTFLHSLLAQHPQVREPLRKEINYFSFEYLRGEAWYRSNFPLRHGSTVTGEATTNYMFHPLAAERMARLVPNARLIVCLREPASRAVSHWRMNRLLGVEDLSFGEAIEREEERVAPDLARVITEPAHPAWSYRRCTYRARGLYLEQIKRLEDNFPKEQILVLDSKELFQDTAQVLTQVERYLGLDEWVPERFRAENVAKQEEPVDEQAVRALREWFEPHNDALFAHIGWDRRW